jgi:hypothetical protein
LHLLQKAQIFFNFISICIDNRRIISYYVYIQKYKDIKIKTRFIGLTDIMTVITDVQERVEDFNVSKSQALDFGKDTRVVSVQPLSSDQRQKPSVKPQSKFKPFL